MRATTLVIGTVPALMLAGAVGAQDYVGDEACSGCHANMPFQGFFDAYRASGHPYKLTHTAGMIPGDDTWPHTPVPPLPMAFGEQLEWSDVEYVIGNYYWKARFIDREGFIWTGDVDDMTQWNLATEGFVPYHPGEERAYNCGRCHTTGYDPDGSQGGLEGLVGTWTEPGIRCEACHGPASEHVDSFGSIAPPGGKTCSECHYRDSEFRMPWSGGFTRHHQQSEDFSHSPHRDMLDCNSCHEPHRSTVYGLGGLTKTCTTCHQGDAEEGFYRVAGMESVACVDCHMPFMGKSAVKFNDYTGDIRGHLFQIMTEPIAAVDNTYEVDGTTFWNQDAEGFAFATLDYSCLGCHIDLGSEITLEMAAAYAEDIHENHAANPGDADRDGVADFMDLLVVLHAWGPCDPDLTVQCEPDLNNDREVGPDDLDLVLEYWTKLLL